MIQIDDEMRKRIDNALEDRCPMFIATVSPDGEPQISMRGSVLVFDPRDPGLLGTRLAQFRRQHRERL